MFVRKVYRNLIFVFLGVFMLSSCAASWVRFEGKPSGAIVPGWLPAEEHWKHEMLLNEIKTRNQTIEKDEVWLKESYERLRIKGIKDLTEKDYPKFGEYLEGGSVYIIVHPAYTSFFNVPKGILEAVDEGGALPKKNAVEKILDKPADNPKFALVQAQERMMRDFLEIKSTEKKLIILVLMRGYKKYAAYAYKDKADEYLRFLNEATNESESVLFIESRSANRGSLKEEDMLQLVHFLINIKPQKVLIGGSYIGRCVEDFYSGFIKEYGEKGVYVVPELTAASPKDVGKNTAFRLLLKDGSLDVEAATEYLKNDIYGRQEKIPEVMNLRGAVPPAK